VRVPRFFGDAMMIHAAIAPLRAAGLPIVMWGPEWVLDLFEGSADVVATVPDPTRKYSPWQASRMLHSHRPAAVINFPKSQRPLAAAFLARVPLRLGCGDGGAWLLCTHSIAFYRQDSPFVERYAGVVRRAYPQLPEPAFRPYRPRLAAMEEAARLRAERGIGPYVVVAPGANCWNKRLPTATLADFGRLARGQGLDVVILGGKGEDQQLAAAIREDFPEAVDLTGQGGLAFSAAWICGAQGLLGVDSGLAHVAGSAGIPTLAVFGPTRPRHSGPWGPRVRTYRVEDLPCLECMGWECPLPDHPCMRRPQAAALWDLLAALMEERTR